MLVDLINEWVSSTATHRSQQLILNASVILATDVGLKRNENQDRVAALRIATLKDGRPSFVCLAVSDGMGGMQDGGECASLTIAALFASLLQPSDRGIQDRLKEATAFANQSVFQKWKGKGGATLSAIIVDQRGDTHTSNVGDSRIYVVNSDKTGTRRVTVDDSLEEAFGGQGRELVQFMGIGSSLLPRVDTLPAGIDSIYLTSDGAHYFDKQILEQLMLRADHPVRASERIVALARWLGGPDNASVAAVKLSDVIQLMRDAPASFPTIWSGASQLQIGADADRSLPANQVASTTAPESTLEEPRDYRKRGASKRKINVRKKEPSAKQLEIDITTDEGDDENHR